MPCFFGAKIGSWLLAMVMLLSGAHGQRGAGFSREKPNYTNFVDITGDIGDTMYQGRRLLLPAAAAAKPLHWRRRGFNCADSFIAAAKQGSVMQAVSNIATTLDDGTSDADGVLALAQDIAATDAVVKTADARQLVVIAYAAAVRQSRQTQEAVALAFGLGMALAFSLAGFGCCCVLLQHYRLSNIN